MQAHGAENACWCLGVVTAFATTTLTTVAAAATIPATTIPATNTTHPITAPVTAALALAIPLLVEGTTTLQTKVSPSCKSRIRDCGDCITQK